MENDLEGIGGEAVEGPEAENAEIDVAVAN
jgi:hypothetical protein